MQLIFQSSHIQAIYIEAEKVNTGEADIGLNNGQNDADRSQDVKDLVQVVNILCKCGRSNNNIIYIYIVEIIKVIEQYINIMLNICHCIDKTYRDNIQNFLTIVGDNSKLDIVIRVDRPLMEERYVIYNSDKLLISDQC